MVPTPLMTGKMQNNRALPFDFDMIALIEEAWHRVKGMKLAVWGAVSILLAIVLGFEALNWFSHHFIHGRLASFLNFFLQLAEFLITFPLWVGVSYLGIRRAADLPVRPLQIFQMYHFSARLFAMVILQVLVVYGLTIIFVLSLVYPFDQSILSIKASILLRCIQLVLGFALFYMSLSFMFSYLLIVEKHLSVWKAYMASFLAFSQHWFKISIALLAMLIIYFASAIIVVGLIWTIPMFSNFMGILYRTAFSVEEPPKIMPSTGIQQSK